MELRKEPLTRPVTVLLLAALCNLLWGSAIPFINMGYRQFAIGAGASAAQILFAGIRFTLAGMLTIFIGSVQRKKPLLPERRNLGCVAALALTQTVMQYVFFYIGVANTASVKASIIQGAGAFVSILIACYIFRSERMNRLKWIGGAAGVLGVIIVNLNGDGLSGGMRLSGEGCLLASMIASACSAGLIKQFSRREDPVTLSGWQFMLGGVIMMIAGLCMGGRITQVTPAGIAVLLYLAMVSAVAYTVWSMLLKVNPVSRVAVYMFLQPVFGVLLGLLMVDTQTQPPLARYALALVCVCASIVIVGRGQQKGE